MKCLFTVELSRMATDKTMLQFAFPKFCTSPETYPRGKTKPLTHVGHLNDQIVLCGDIHKELLPYYLRPQSVTIESATETMIARTIC